MTRNWGAPSGASLFLYSMRLILFRPFSIRDCGGAQNIGFSPGERMGRYAGGPSSRKQFFLRGLTAKGAVKPSKGKFLSLIGAKRNMPFNPSGSEQNSFLVPDREPDLLRGQTDTRLCRLHQSKESQMKVTRKSLITGKVQTIELPVNPEDLATYQAGKALIQDVFPHLTPEQREFIATGITPEEWAAHIADEDDEDDEDIDYSDPEAEGAGRGSGMTIPLRRQSPDGIFWIGNRAATVLLNYTTAKAYAIITRDSHCYCVDMRLSAINRLRLWRYLQPFERKRMSWLGGACCQLSFDSMWEAVTDVDQTLEALGVIPARVDVHERFYLLFRPATEDGEKQ